MAVTGRKTAARQSLAAELPFFSLALLAGCLTFSQLPALPRTGLLVPGVLVALLAALCLPQPRLRLLLVGLVLGFAYAAFQAQWILDSRLTVPEHGDERWFEGYISDLPVARHTERGQTLRFFYEPKTDGLKRIRVAWYQNQVVPAAGECWRLKLRLRIPRGSLNPGGMDYEGWLFRQRIDATASVKEAEPCASSGFYPVARMRQKLVSLIRDKLGEHPMRPFVLGLAVGERSEISDTQWRVLRRTGAAHLLAISGLHIGLVAGFVFLLMRILWPLMPRLAVGVPAPVAAAVVSAIAGLIYAALAGFSLPTQRALLMLLLALLGLALRQRLQSHRLIAIAVVLVLLIDPFAGNAAGFWLSLGAVAWIFYALQSRLRRPGKLHTWLYLQLLLGCSLLPLSLWWFGEGSWLAPLVNLFLIPAFFLLVPIIVVASGGLFFLPDVSTTLLTLAADMLNWIWQILALLESVSMPLMAGAAPSVLMILLALVGLLWLFAPMGWPQRGMGLLLCLPLGLGISGFTQAVVKPGELSVTVLDVGQGLSVILRSQQHVLVYDSGPAYEGGFDAGAMVLVPFLRYQGVQQVDLYLQSHGDLDHRGGIEALRGELNVIDELGTDTSCRAGHSWHWDGIEFEVLHPDRDGWSGNNASCVLRVSTGNQKLLLTGDIERDAEAHLLQRAGGKLEADVLVVPHHGSNSSSSMGLLNRVNPQFAIVSAGWRNRWGMPREEVVARYQVRDIRLLNTADSGAISFRMTGKEALVMVQTRMESRRFWHAD